MRVFATAGGCTYLFRNLQPSLDDFPAGSGLNNKLHTYKLTLFDSRKILQQQL
jgi:hypothetical protein